MRKLIFAASIVFVLAGCEIGGIRGNGHIVTESRNAPAFRNVVISGAFEVEWRSGPPSVAVTADENLMPLIEARVSGGTLRVSTTRSVRPSHALRSLKLALTSPSLESASFNGASNFTAHQLTGSRFSLKTAGASKVMLDGAVGELVASMTGASELHAESLPTKTAELEVTGAGDARVNVTDALKVSITGAGRVEYSGNPEHVEKHVTGAGTIRKRE
jgi:Putative auto-transporter adhesin, head GIN domain/Prokaryotic membrane lipoprotein lipid attachment site